MAVSCRSTPSRAVLAHAPRQRVPQLTAGVGTTIVVRLPAFLPGFLTATVVGLAALAWVSRRAAYREFAGAASLDDVLWEWLLSLWLVLPFAVVSGLATSSCGAIRTARVLVIGALIGLLAPVLTLQAIKLAPEVPIVASLFSLIPTGTGPDGNGRLLTMLATSCSTCILAHCAEYSGCSLSGGRVPTLRSSRRALGVPCEGVPSSRARS